MGKIMNLNQNAFSSEQSAQNTPAATQAQAAATKANLLEALAAKIIKVRASNDLVKLRGTYGHDFHKLVNALLIYSYCSQMVEAKVNSFERSHEPGFEYADFSFPEGYSVEEHFAWYVPHIGFCLEPSLLLKNVLKDLAYSTQLPQVLNQAFAQLVASAALGSSAWAQALPKMTKGIDFTSMLESNELERSKKLTNLLQVLSEAELSLETKPDAISHAEALDYLQNEIGVSSRLDEVTPPEVAELVVKLALAGTDKVTSVYDPSFGTGALLRKVAQSLEGNVEFYGQEEIEEYQRIALNHFCLLGHPDKLHIEPGDALLEPSLNQERKFSLVVSKPPFLFDLTKRQQRQLELDERFMGLTPIRYPEFAYALHCLSRLADNGTCALILPSRALSRPADENIREFLVTHNLVHAVVELPKHLVAYFGPACSILVLKRNRNTQEINFINATAFAERPTGKRARREVLTPEGLEQVLSAYTNAEDIPGFSKLVAIDQLSRDYSLSVLEYVKAPKEASTFAPKQARASFTQAAANTEQGNKSFAKLLANLEVAQVSQLTEAQIATRLEHWQQAPLKVAKEVTQGLGLAEDYFAGDTMTQIQLTVAGYQPNKPLEVAEHLLLPTTKVIQYIYGGVWLTVEQVAKKIPTVALFPQTCEEGNVALLGYTAQPLKFIAYDKPHLGEAVLIARTGPSAGDVSFYDGPKVINRAIGLAGKDELVLTKYLFQFLKTQEETLKQKTHGRTAVSLPAVAVLNLPVWVPDLQKQASLAEQLGHAQDLMQALETQLTLVKQLDTQLRNHLFSVLGLN